MSKRLFESANCDAYELLKAWAKQNRKEPTEAEKLLWQHIRVRESGLHFRRQHIIGDYIVDFVCLDRHVIVEVDGEYHQEEQQTIKDDVRNKKLEELGFTILHFTNEEVIANPQNIANIIVDTATKRPSTSSNWVKERKGTDFF